MNDDIIVNSYYMIDLFHQNNKEITNLKLQKLMYFSEALYLNFYEDKERMFNDEFCAWTYGPVCPRLYNKFKSFKNINLELTEEQEKEIYNLNPSNQEIMKLIYSSFGDFDTSFLVALTHQDDSPWTIAFNRNTDENFADQIISKEETKRWFKKQFMKELSNDDIR